MRDISCSSCTAYFEKTTSNSLNLILMIKVFFFFFFFLFELSLVFNLLSYPHGDFSVFTLRLVHCHLLTSHVDFSFRL
jgi:hypothetical protein